MDGYDVTRLRHLITYEFTGVFCRNPSSRRITDFKDLHATARKSSWPWEWRGNQAPPQGFGVGTRSGRAEAEGEFESCLFHHGCINSMTVGIIVYVFGDGTWYFRSYSA